MGDQEKEIARLEAEILAAQRPLLAPHLSYSQIKNVKEAAARCVAKLQRDLRDLRRKIARGG